MVHNPEHIPIPHNGTRKDDVPENSSRRKFLKKSVEAGVALGVTAGLGSQAKRFLDEEARKQELKELKETLHAEHGEEVEHSQNETETATQKEEVPVVTTPLEQLEAWGEIRDLRAGIHAIQTNEYRELTTSPNGKEDMRRAAQNIALLNMRKVVEPYRKYNLPEELAYMIAIQETRGRNLTSSAGAKGVTGLMPSTIQSMGFNEKDADNPYKASVMTARYLATERDERFGNDTDLLLHAYNAGGGLLGYTKTKQRKEERNVDDFYEYMQDYINRTYKKIEQSVHEYGYFKYTLGRGDKTLWNVSQNMHVPLSQLLEMNGYTEETVVHSGDTIKVPCTDPLKAAKHVFKHSFEALRYVPELKAKYTALKTHGLLKKIELAMGNSE